MKTILKIGSLLGLMISLLSTQVQGLDLKPEMYADLDYVKSVFRTKYAPLEWKGEYCGVSLDEEIAVAKSKLASLANPTVKDYQIVLRSFFNSMKDYHVGAVFYSTESATLPFTIKSAEGRYFISHVAAANIGSFLVSCAVGDEVIAVDHMPISKVIEKLKQDELGRNTPETDQALAELLLTQRKGEEGHRVPKGEIVFTLKSQRTGQERDHTFTWTYTEEKIADLAQIPHPKAQMASLDLGFHPFKNKTQLKELINKSMVFPFFQKNGPNALSNPHLPGARKSFIPRLGEILWESGNNYTFDAYIFYTEEGKTMGYIRLPHYAGDEEQAADFERVISLFEQHVDAMVIDQVNNPGGSVFYFYALASMLTDKPIYAPKHRVALTQEEIYKASTILPSLEAIQTEHQAREVLGDTVGGYPVTMEMVDLLKQFYRFLISEWNAGKMLTSPIHVFCVDAIKPHPRTRFSKPIVLLTNSLDFSGGDLFPAILKDAKRAVILGKQTAGASGVVHSTQHFNRLGVMGFNLTGSIAYRKDQTPIENLGVEPDILYEHTVRDLQENYVDYVNMILTVLDSATDAG